MGDEDLQNLLDLEDAMRTCVVEEGIAVVFSIGAEVVGVFLFMLASGSAV